MGAYSLAPPPSWSQVVGESPGCRVTASSGGMTDPSTPATGMSRYLPPPPGLPPIDFSKWRLLPPEAPASRGPTAPPNLPGVGRSDQLRGTAKRIAGAPRPGGLAQRMPALPTSMLCVPQMVPPLRQPHLEQPATPYQQAVQLPKKPAWRGVISDTPTDKTTPVGGASSQDRGRPTTREGGETAADPSVAQEVYRGRRVWSHRITRAICPPGQCLVSHHHHQHLKEPASAGRSAKVCPL